MKIAVIGAGYVGLVTAAGFAEFGNDVTVIDAVEAKITALEKGEIPFYEPGLEDIVQRNFQDHRIHYAIGIDKATLDKCDVVFLCVGTPQSDDGSADLTALWDVVKLHLGLYVPERPKLLVLKSTVPVGTGFAVRQKLAMVSDNWKVANNPEFLREGTAVEDFLRPDRVVVGVADPWSEGVLRRLYEPVANCGPLMVMDSSSAELTKYCANSMLAMRISFMNEVARVAEKVGADAEFVRRGVGADKRIGSSYLYPSPGFGGSCFTKDLAALIHTASEEGEEMLLARATLEVNRSQKHIPVAKLKALLGGSLKGKKVGVWGLSFKPYTDDIRDSPAIVVVQDLLAEGAEVRVHDPKATENFLKLFPNGGEKGLSWCSDKYSAAAGADGVILVTEWREYRMPDFMHLKFMAPNVSVVDARNVWREDDARAAGIPYARIGRASRGL